MRGCRYRLWETVESLAPAHIPLGRFRSQLRFERNDLLRLSDQLILGNEALLKNEWVTPRRKG